MYKNGDKLKAINNQPLPGNDKAPALEVGKEYTIKGILTEQPHGYQHLDVGLESKLNYIRSYETKEELEAGDKIHWCHPSRFEKV